MNYQDYLKKVKTKIVNMKQINITGLDTSATYEEVFKWKWIATKLKIFSFLAYVDRVDEDLLKTYSKQCLRYANKNKKGLPRGFQNGVVSYNILASENVDVSAITFISKRPDKHWAAFEYPIIVDLSKKELFYYREDIIWGTIYDSFLKKYVMQNFNMNE